MDDDWLYTRKDFGSPLSPSVGESFAFDSHPSGWARSKVTAHENGHVRVARALGCSARVVNIDGRRPYAQIISGPPLTPAQHAAIAFGGEAAAGSGGCGKDRGKAEAALRALPWAARGAARAEAWRIARRYA